ncbi:MAG: T9SS type A sorting domain-containing protein, partial [Candidatus Eiseniibacteriota bacterium]
MIGVVSRLPRSLLAGTIALIAPLCPGDGRAVCSAECPTAATWSQPFSFARLSWERKSGCGGPGPNCWAPANVEEVAGEGIRLRLTRQAGRWYAAEMRTTAPVPEGRYSVQLVGRPDLLDQNVVLGVFLYDDAAGEIWDPCPAELDLESSRFGDPTAPNGHFVTYGSGGCSPADLADVGYTLTGSYTTHQIDWTSGAVSFRLMHGHRNTPDLPEHLIGERRFVSPLVPAAGGMRLHVNLWAFAGNAPTDQQEVEMVIRDIVAGGPVLAAEPPPSASGRALAVRQNPARGGVDILFTLPADGHARVAILDVAGRRAATLVDASFPAGPHRLRWDPGPATPGVYFIRLEVGGHAVTRRFV